MFGLRRSWFGFGWVLVSVVAASAQERVEIGFGYVEERAREASTKPFVKPRDERPLPEALKALNYDDYRRIQFRRDIAPWKDDNLNFHLHFFFPGYSYLDSVILHEFTKTHAQRIRFMQNLFQIDPGILRDVSLPEDLGYAGFRLTYPLNQPDKFDELAVFHGASYFRMLGKGMAYGLSARGLALNSGMPGVPEEFPIFTEFWIGKPTGNIHEITLYALMNSESVAGAYQFTIKPGEATDCRVQATLFFRKIPELIGLAPMSSMHWFGENSRSKPDDFRPEVHDSDGLAIRSSTGECLWRPAQNDQATLHQNVFQFVKDNESVTGFGLLQRDRQYSNYEDPEANYHIRPGLWVVPEGSWGPGRVHLVELSAHNETDDNLVAMWQPRDPPKVGEPFRFAYRLYWTADANPTQAGSWVKGTRVGLMPWRPGERLCVVDFTGPAIDKLPPDAKLDAIVEPADPSLALVKDVVVHRYQTEGSWRLSFWVRPAGVELPKQARPEEYPKLKPPQFKAPIELRAYLKKGEDVLSETWNYRLDP